MQGGPGKLDGLIQQGFKYLEAVLQESSDYTYNLSCQMVQVYYSTITDLLLPKNGRLRKLVIKKDIKDNFVMVEGATIVPVDFTDAKELERVYYQGLDTRTMRSTFVNETSSRSHLLFSIFIERTDKRGRRTLGKITYIDLAGSESLNEIGVDPIRYKEGMQINESLICLGWLIRQVACKVTPAYDLHPLTELMQDSLRSDSKTLMISCISPSIYDLAQTRQTLDYAMTTGTISNKPTSVNFQTFLATTELYEQQILQSIVRSWQIYDNYERVKRITVPNLKTIVNKSP